MGSVWVVLPWVWIFQALPGRECTMTTKLSILFFFLKLFSFYVHWCFVMGVGSLELGSQTAVSCHMAAGNRTQDLWKNSQCSSLSHLSSP